MRCSFKFFSTVFLGIILTNCSGSNFAGNGGVKKEENKDPALTTNGQPVTEEFRGDQTTAGSKPVDIMFAVDTSGSMLAEQDKLEATMATFLNAFVSNSSNIDYQVFLIASGFKFQANLDTKHFSIVDESVGSNDAYEIVADFLDKKFTSSLTVRPTSVKQLVVITDDDAPSTISDIFGSGFSADHFKTKLNQLNVGEFHVNGLVGLKTGANNSWCNIVRVGAQYQKLAADPAHSGLIQDLCQEDWSALLQRLASSISAQIKVQNAFTLSRPVNPGQPIKVDVNGVTVGTGSYSVSGTILTFNAGSEPTAGSTIAITYTPM